MTATITESMRQWIRPTPDGSEIFLAWVDPTVARPNPGNWKRHPDDQLAALDALIFGGSGVGWVDCLVINWRRETDGWTPSQAGPIYLDGHARRRLAAQRGEQVLALVGHWNPNQEKIILATLDLLTRLITVDADRTRNILKMATTDDVAIVALYQRLAQDAGLVELSGGEPSGDVSQGPDAGPGAGSGESPDPADVADRPKIFRVGEWSSVMSSDEWNGLNQAALDYQEKNGTLKGFASEALLV